MKNFTLIVLVLFCSCQQKSTSPEELFEADRLFSKTATEVGFNKAFVDFAHDDAVLLKENSMPIKGKQAIQSVYSKLSADGIDFTWEPIGGYLAKSGELGYTYGTYVVKTDSTFSEGTYVSVWKKDSSGNWKYILDSGNQGLGSPEK